MTILQIFNRYQYRGGEEASVLRIADTLGQNHKVIRCYFESEDWAERKGVFHYASMAFQMLYNRNSVARIRKHMEEDKPDLILLHNTFPICSAAALLLISWSKIPKIQVIHNFRPFSVNGYCWADDKICDSGLKLNFLPEILAGSWQQSRLRTAWYALILLLMHALGVYYRMNHWIAISAFMKQKFVEAGIPEERITTLRHSWFPGPTPARYGRSAENQKEDPYLLYLGRLSSEKGVDRMLEAWEKVCAESTSGRLVIGGSGPLESMVRIAARNNPRVEYIGEAKGEAKIALLAGSRAVVVPSCWWEPLGIVVYEAYDHGKPVIASSSAGLAETVIHGKTGIVHKPGDAMEMARHMRKLLEDPTLAESMGREGRHHLLEIADPAAWADAIEKTLFEITKTQALGTSKETDTSPDIPIRITAYLADQNPKLGRSLGISRMTEVVLNSISQRRDIELDTITSSSSIQGPESRNRTISMPWQTKNNFVRILSDNLHPLMVPGNMRPDIWFYPKGFMPRLHSLCQPSVAMIHDTIIQYYQDKYPQWRTSTEYNYWAAMLRQTLVHASEIMTVSNHSRRQIEDFIRRNNLPPRKIHVTYEPCVYENIPQPGKNGKSDYVLHLGSREPHKRTAWLIRQWSNWLSEKLPGLPKLHVVGHIPREVRPLLAANPQIVHLPYLEDHELIEQYKSARAFLFPSEIEGFGLPAIESYYLGTPVCHVEGTAVEEILSVATHKGCFRLDDPGSLQRAIHEILTMSHEEISAIGIRLRDQYHSDKVVTLITGVFKNVIHGSNSHFDES